MESIHDVIRFYAKEPVKVTPQASFYRAAAIYRVQAGGKSFGVKKFVGTPQELQFVTDFLQHLERQEYPHSPRLLRTLDGDPYVLQQADGYLAMTWHRQTTPFDGKDPVQLAAAARAIAKLHQLSRSFDSRLRRRHFVGREPLLWQHKHEQFAKGYQRLRQLYPNHPFTRQLNTQMPQLLLESERATAALNGRAMASYLARDEVKNTVCHRDITNPNLLYDKSRERLHLIDFDSIGHSLPLIDLDKFLSNCLDWNGSLILRALFAYHAEEPLPREALDLLFQMMSLPKEEWFLQQQFLAARTKAKQQRLTAQLRLVLQRRSAKREALARLSRVRVRHS